MRRFLLVSLALLLTGGCGLAPSAEERAAEDARDKARRVGQQLYSGRVRAAQDVAHLAGDIDGVEVMRVSGTTTAGDGAGVVVRLSGTSAQGRPSMESVTVVRCFELRFSTGSEGGDEPRDVECPAGEPLVFESWPKTPEIPDERLRKALPLVPRDGAVDEREVREAVASLGLDPAIHAEVKAENGVVGVLLRVKPYMNDAFDCTLARVAPGRTDVWSPPRIQRMPGEGGCFVSSALHPLRPPH
ncbi:hypothetical protein [Actinocorallia aurantiaca]